MRVAVVGAGALGRAYGLLLGARGGCDVTFVVRKATAPDRFALASGWRVSDEPALRVRRGREMVSWGRREGEVALVAPRCVTDGDARADVIILAVRAEQVEAAALAPWVLASTAPVVCVTPMLPTTRALVAARLGERLVGATPSIIADSVDDTTRYWVPPFARTRIEPRHARILRAPLEALARALERAGIATVFDARVAERNPAMTIAFLPLMMMLSATRGRAYSAVTNAILVADVRQALGETRTLAKHVGSLPPLASFALGLCSPAMLRLTVGVMRQLAPELLAYLEVHFGVKLVAQNFEMAREAIAIAASSGTPVAGLSALRERMTRASAS